MGLVFQLRLLSHKLGNRPGVVAAVIVGAMYALGYCLATTQWEWLYAIALGMALVGYGIIRSPNSRFPFFGCLLMQLAFGVFTFTVIKMPNSLWVGIILGIWSGMFLTNDLRSLLKKS